VAGTVLPDHDAGGLGGVVLRGDIHLHFAHGVREDLALPLELLEAPHGHAGLALRVRPEHVMLDAVGAAPEHLAPGLDAPGHFLKVGQLQRERLQLAAHADHAADFLAVHSHDARVVLGEHGPGERGFLQLRLALLQSLPTERCRDAPGEVFERGAAPAFLEVGGDLPGRGGGGGLGLGFGGGQRERSQCGEQKRKNGVRHGAIENTTRPPGEKKAAGNAMRPG
jgi:hypothetical protein